MQQVATQQVVTQLVVNQQVVTQLVVTQYVVTQLVVTQQVVTQLVVMQQERRVASDVCARHKRFKLVTVRRQMRGERDTLTSRCYDSMTITK